MFVIIVVIGLYTTPSIPLRVACDFRKHLLFSSRGGPSGTICSGFLHISRWHPEFSYPPGRTLLSLLFRCRPDTHYPPGDNMPAGQIKRKREKGKEGSVLPQHRGKDNITGTAKTHGQKNKHSGTGQSHAGRGKIAAAGRKYI